MVYQDCIRMSHTSTPLPSLRSPLFGREQACVQLVDMIRAGCPLVTVTGAGGVGKTSVALAVGQRLLDAFDQRVIFVELADVESPEDVASVIVSALRLPVNSDRTLETTLSNALGFRRTLLILDNMEHVRGAAPLVGRLLEQAPLLSVLVTSRVAIGSSLENVFALVPLPCDAPTAAAIELFAARAVSSSGGFVLDERNIASVMELCRRLDGLPLAIELAASRTAMLEPAALLERLCRPTTGDAVGAGGLLVLRGIEHDRHRRHRALTTTIEWSVQLLEPAHRDLLDALAVFDGGWTLESAEAVWGTVSDDGFAAFEGVNALLRHHLIMREPATEVDKPPANPAIGAPRYRMLETIRQYVIEHGIDPDQAELWNDRHAWCFVELASRPALVWRAPTKRRGAVCSNQRTRTSAARCTTLTGPGRQTVCSS